MVTIAHVARQKRILKGTRTYLLHSTIWVRQAAPSDFADADGAEVGLQGAPGRWGFSSAQCPRYLHKIICFCFYLAAGEKKSCQNWKRTKVEREGGKIIIKQQPKKYTNISLLFPLSKKRLHYANISHFQGWIKDEWLEQLLYTTLGSFYKS